MQCIACILFQKRDVELFIWTAESLLRVAGDTVSVRYLQFPAIFNTQSRNTHLKKKKKREIGQPNITTK